MTDELEVEGKYFCAEVRKLYCKTWWKHLESWLRTVHSYYWDIWWMEWLWLQCGWVKTDWNWCARQWPASRPTTSSRRRWVFCSTEPKELKASTDNNRNMADSKSTQTQQWWNRSSSVFLLHCPTTFQHFSPWFDYCQLSLYFVILLGTLDSFQVQNFIWGNME